MARKRRVSKRRSDLTPEQIAWLNGDDNGAGFFKYHNQDELAEFWAEHGERVVAEHVEEYPGTRPRRWWQYDAPRMQIGSLPGDSRDGKLPEIRKRLGGVGTPCHECLSYVANSEFGLPTSWLSADCAKYYRGTARDVNNNQIGTEHFGRGFTGFAIDSANQPLYESQAAYLKRHKLFLPGEARRLAKQDFEPEAIV